MLPIAYINEFHRVRLGSKTLVCETGYMDELATGRLASIFGRNLRTFRESLGMSQTDLARAMQAQGWEKYSQVSVSRTEEGSRTVRLDEAFALAQCVRESVDSLLRAPEISKWYSSALSAGTALEEATLEVDMACVKYVSRLRELRELMNDTPSKAELDKLTGISEATAPIAIEKMKKLAAVEPRREVRSMIDDAAEFLEIPLGYSRNWRFEKENDDG